MAQTDSRPMKAVVNSTPLIALSMLNHLFVLKALFDEIFVPSSVYEEVVLKGGNRPGSQEVVKADWIIVKEPAESFPLPPELLGLDEYGVKQETSKRVERKIKSIKDYPVCGMWADREDMVDSARWVKEITKKHWEYRHDTPTG